MKELGKGFAAAFDVASYYAWNFKDKGGIAQKEAAFKTAVPDAEERAALREQAATLLFGGGKEGGSFFNKRVGAPSPADSVS